MVTRSRVRSGMGPGSHPPHRFFGFDENERDVVTRSRVRPGNGPRVALASSISSEGLADLVSPGRDGNGQVLGSSSPSGSGKPSCAVSAGCGWALKRTSPASSV